MRSINIGNKMHVQVIFVCFQASVTITGPRSEPPMPIFTTSVMALPVKPFHVARYNCFAKSFHLLQYLVHIRHYIFSIYINRGVAAVTKAICSTGRPSVTLIFSPENMASVASFTLHSFASCINKATVWSSMRFLE